MEERLQKIIARAGVTSRRAAEELITAGRVRVNGRLVTELGAKADPRNDKIEVDGQRLVAEAPVYLVLHKPRNVVSTMSDPEGRPTVGELVRSAGARVYPVGRLDFATSGVLLMTNDGEFSNGLLHPRGGVPKTYVLKVRGQMTEEDAEVWRTGVELEDGKTLPADVRILRLEGDKTWLEITLREGRNQQIRRMGEATGFPVMRLARLSFAGVTSESLLPGRWRLLTVDELLAIRKEFGVPKRVRPAVDRAPTQRPKPRARIATVPSERAERPTRETRGEHPRARRDEAPRARRDEAPRARRDEAPRARRDEAPRARRDEGERRVRPGTRPPERSEGKTQPKRARRP